MQEVIDTGRMERLARERTAYWADVAGLGLIVIVDEHRPPGTVFEGAEEDFEALVARS